MTSSFLGFLAAWVGPGMLLQHALVLFLIVVAPLWDRYEIPRLKASTEPRKKVRYYGKIVGALWACAVVAALTAGLVTVFTIQKSPSEISWLAGSLGKAVVEGVTGGIVIAVMVPAVLALWSEKIRTKAGKAAKKLAFLLPSTGEERRWWWLVCITAGVCEEVVYRGFLLHYFHTLPFHLSLTWALVVSAVIFGIGHLYQGVAGAVQTTVMGFMLGAIFLTTGNLVIPIVVHAVMDLRALAMLPEGFATVE
jgi:membrane protease YdiL (CAAX protease family)